jgi:hypothetical protein
MIQIFEQNSKGFVDAECKTSLSGGATVLVAKLALGNQNARP